MAEFVMSVVMLQVSNTYLLQQLDKPTVELLNLQKQTPDSAVFVHKRRLKIVNNKKKKLPLALLDDLTNSMGDWFPAFKIAKALSCKCT